MKTGKLNLTVLNIKSPIVLMVTLSRITQTMIVSEWKKRVFDKLYRIEVIEKMLLKAVFVLHILMLVRAGNETSFYEDINNNIETEIQDELMSDKPNKEDEASDDSLDFNDPVDTGRRKGKHESTLI